MKDNDRKEYLDILIKSEKMWEWLCDNPFSRKENFPKFREYKIDKCTHHCLICEYRFYRTGNVCSSCLREGSILKEFCHLYNVCMTYHDDLFDNVSPITEELWYRSTKKIYMKILEERLRVM